MEVNTTQEFTLSLTELKKVIVKDMIRKGHISEDTDLENIKISDVTKTESIPGADVHDAHYYDTFDGIKITVKS